MTGKRSSFNAAGHAGQSTKNRDARLDAARLGDMVRAGDDDAAFAAAHAAEPGSQLPMLMAIARDAQTPDSDTTARMRARLPWLDFWYDHDFVRPLFDGTASGGERWFENTRMTPRDRDDGFIIKAALVSDHASSMVPYLIDLGEVNLNTRNDRPVTLAVVLGKADLLPLLAESGADLFANNNEAFRLARAQSSFDVYTALHGAARDAQKISQKKLMLRTPQGIRLADLRSGDDETGLHLAAKAGMMPLLLRQDILSGLCAADFLKPSSTGATAAGVMAALGQFDTLFDERIWLGRYDEADKVYDFLSPEDRRAASHAYSRLMMGRDLSAELESFHASLPDVRLPPRPKNPQDKQGPKGPGGAA